MGAYLRISFRFLSAHYHGKRDEGKAEWPPSPMRVFQALVATAARAGKLDSAMPTLRWFEQLEAPIIFASEASLTSAGYRLSVPHNAMDLVGRQWAAGKEGSAAEHRTMKDVRPFRLPDEAAVHYVWQFAEEALARAASHVEVLVELARHVVALGWGVDLVVGDGGRLSGSELREFATGPVKQWEPKRDGSTALRVPRAGTLEDLVQRHEAFSRRTSLADSTLRPPPTLSAFTIISYGRTDEKPKARVARFLLMRVDSDRMRAFQTDSKGMAVAGMLRHAARSTAENAGWNADRVAATILGHGETTAPRILILPVPSIEERGGGHVVVTSIRRVLIAATDRRDEVVDWAQRALGGADLIDEKSKESVALLASVPTGDRVFEHYLEPSATWATVTPVVLPGHDDPGGLRSRLRKKLDADEQKIALARLARRQDALLRKALRHAGFPDELVFNAVIETRAVGFFAGVERVDRYAMPKHLRDYPRLHVRIRWDRPVPGPICIGRGRFSGMGLFAAQH